MRERTSSSPPPLIGGFIPVLPPRPVSRGSFPGHDKPAGGRACHVQTGALTLAVSTSRRCPALSRHIRQQLEAEFGSPYSDFVALLVDCRERSVNTLPLAQRRVIWKSVFESNAFALLASANKQAADRLARALLGQQGFE